MILRDSVLIQIGVLGDELRRRVITKPLLRQMVTVDEQLIATFGLRSAHHNRDTTSGWRKFVKLLAAASRLPGYLVCDPCLEREAASAGRVHR